MLSSVPNRSRRVRCAITPKFPSLARQWRNGLPAILSHDPMPLTEEAVTTIWIEILRHADGRARYSSRGRLYRTRLGGPDGEVLVESTVAPVCPSCRALMARGIIGSFETWRAGIPYACLRGDIEKTAGLAIEEGNTTSVRFKRWLTTHPGSRDGVSSGSGRAPAREGDEPGRGVPLTAVALP